jgi:hypothetical protein
VSETPASPRAGRLAAPSWLDARLVLGVLLVLVSVVVGARVLSSADRTQLVWAAARDLAPGTVLSDDDLRRAEVRLFDSADGYLTASGAAPVGYVLERQLAAGELVPRLALGDPGDEVDRRFVTVPVLPGHFPPGLVAGQQVDVWATPDRTAAQAAGTAPEEAPAAEGLTGTSRLVLPAVTVASAADGGGALGGATAERAIVLVVAPDDVGLLVEAMSTGRIDLVRVPGPGERGGAPAPALEGR